MGRTAWLAGLTLALALPLLATLPAAAGSDGACAERLCAGAASVDATWHTGAGQGQLGGAGNHLSEDKFDPYHHTTKMVPTDGVQSRTFAKAVVVQGPDGTKAAYVKTDVYLQQAILTARVAQLVTGADPTADRYAVEGLTAEGIMLGGTHNHSVPHYTSTAWGVWIFADAFDLRAFDHTAKRIAQAIKEADEALRPARVGASVTRLTEVQQNILGPTTADDGTPAGFPRDHFDPELAVVRFDEAQTGEPIAALVSLGMHPESIGGNANLVSGDFIGVVERDVERALGRAPGDPAGPVVAWSQGALGDVEPDASRANHPDEGREFWRRDFAQAERMSRDITAAVLRTWQDVADGTPDVPEKFVPLSADAPVDVLAYRFPGPVAHPQPTVSNCRTEQPGAPVLGFPDCVRPPQQPPGWGATAQRLSEAGLPVPDNYGVPTYGSVHEAMTIHLQVIRIGEVLLGACPCEPVTDMTLNFKTRTDRTDGNTHLGWLPDCEERADGVRCAFPRHAWQPPEWRDVDPDAYGRMRAQVLNDAAGWEDDPSALLGEHEPADPEEVYGNFTHTALGAEHGFTLPLMVGTANDYVGYVVTYREFQRGDHYRKALTAYGPHTADYINTRLVQMAAQLRDPAAPGPRDARDVVFDNLDELLLDGRARVFGSGSDAGTQAYESALPDDGGEPGTVVAQPDPAVERFSAATLSWQGGSNYTDNPQVAVERREGDGTWRTVATQAGGEVVVSLAYDRWTSEAPLRWLAGGQTYTWTATYEVFDATEPGTYRFVVDGLHRSDRQPNPYRVESDPFAVDVWRGLEVRDLAVDRAAGTVSFDVVGHEDEFVGPRDIPADAVRYPVTYDSEVPFIQGRRIEDRGAWRYCFRCTFRAWATHGLITEATVTVQRTPPGLADRARSAPGQTRTYEAAFDGQRWVVEGLTLRDGDVVYVRAGAVRDEYGNTNGQRVSAG